MSTIKGLRNLASCANIQLRIIDTSKDEFVYERRTREEYFVPWAGWTNGCDSSHLVAKSNRGYDTWSLTSNRLALEEIKSRETFRKTSIKVQA